MLAMLAVLALLWPSQTQAQAVQAAQVAEAAQVGVTSLELAQPRDWVARVDSLLAAGEAAQALERLEVELAAAPYDAELLWRAAQAATLLGLLSPILIEARPDYRRAIDYAEAALDLQPDHLQARTWGLAAKGRLALWTDARETARLGDEVWQESHALLAEQVASIRGFVRWMGRVLVGGEALSQGSWTQALEHLRRATALEPRNKLFALQLGRALIDHGDEVAGIAELGRGLAVPVVTPLDARMHFLLEQALDATDG
jgi:tetratricopeptide (TPR) repeat protein